MPAGSEPTRFEGALKTLFLSALLALSLMTPAFPRTRCASCARSRGHIRSAKAKRAFRQAHPCPATGRTSGACPGYVIDHVVPLKRGGADAPSNMQWQTTAEGKAKDRVE